MPHKLTLPDPPYRQALAKIAAVIIQRFVPRAFPDTGGTARSRSGTPVKPLSEKYRRYKSGEGPQRPKARKEPKGRGPLVEGRRLTPRSGTADARLTDKTAKEFGAVRFEKNAVTMGWRSSRGKRVGAALQARNKMLPLSTREQKATREAITEALRPWIRRGKIRGVVQIKL
jgi:hypothetical protein